MRIEILRCYLLCVLVASVLVKVSSVTTRTPSNLGGFVHVKATDQGFIAINRLLRVHNTEDEERMTSVHLPDLSQLLNAGKSVDEVFGVFKLNKGVEKLLTNQNLKSFIRYVDEFNLLNPGNGASAIKSITKAYGDDVVARTLQLAKKNPDMDSMAEKLLSDQRQLWLTNKQSPDDVFKLLKLNQAANNPLNNPNLDVWTSYLKLFNHHTRYTKPFKEQSSMIKTFTTAYGDDALAKMLLTAKDDPATESIAKNLQLAQFTRWMSYKPSPNLLGKKNSEPYKTILNQYRSFYKLHSN